MKTLNRIISIAFFLVLFASCRKDFLNVIPKDQLTDEVFWKTEKDADMALTGLYNNWESWFNILWWDLMTDNGYSQFPWDNVSVIGNGQVTASNTGRIYFSYDKIREYNNFLEKIDLVTMDLEKK